MAAESDEEQVELLKAWWDENGNSLLISVGVALVAVFGYRAWQNSVAETAEAASALYDDLAVAVVNVHADTMSSELLASSRAIGDQLKLEYPDSTYAHFGALFMARLAVDKKDYPSAEAELRWILDSDVDERLEPVARIRLARVLAAQNRVDDALMILSADIEIGAYQSSRDEVRGDLYYQQGEMDQARQAYQKAFDSLGDGVSKPLLQGKLEDLVLVDESISAADTLEEEQAE